MIKKSSLLLLVLLCPVLHAGGNKEGTELRVWSWRANDGAVWKQVQQWLNDEGDDVTIEYQAFLPTEYDAKLLAALQGGEGPDIAYIRRLPGSRSDALVRGGLVLPLDDFDFSAFSPAIKGNYVYQGHPYGVPFAVQVVGIFYNKDVFDAKELTEPRTWDELIAIAESFKAEGKPAFFLPGKDGWALVMQHAAMGVSLLQPDWIRQLIEGETDFLDPKWVQLNQKVYQLKPYAQKGFLANSTSDLETAFAISEVPMVFYGSWGVPVWKELNPDIHIGYFMVPPMRADQSPYAYVYVDGLLSVVTSSPNAELAKKVLARTTTKQFGQMFTATTLNLSPIAGVSLKNAPLFSEIAITAEKSAAPYVYWVGSPLVASSPSLYGDVLSPGLQALYADKITPADLAQQSQDALLRWYEPLQRYVAGKAAQRAK